MRLVKRSTMTEKRVDCFFYGLFMDEGVLANSGVNAKNPRRAFVQNYALFIGARATLGRSNGSRAYGMVFEVTHEDLNRLYGSPGLEEYLPEAIIVSTLEGAASPALCYNLSIMPGPNDSNPEYASKLRAVLNNLDFPSEYVSGVS
jgi:hypothetical protein